MAILKTLGLLEKKEMENLIKYEIKPLYNHRKIHIGNIESEITN